MLFIHQAPKGFTEQGRAQTPTRTSQGQRPASRGNKRPDGSSGGSNSGPRRPSSAVGNHTSNRGAGDTPTRRPHESDRNGPNSRPGSANIIGRFGLRGRHSPPVSARSTGPPGVGLGSSGGSGGTHGAGGEQRNSGGSSGAVIPSMRPMTPNGRYQLGQVRTSTPGPVRVPSVGPTALPLHIAPGPGPTQQSRPRSPSNGAAQKRALPSSSPGSAHRETKAASDSASTSAPSSRPESAAGQNSSSSGSGGGGSSSGNGQRDANNLTTVISSALDYKRFLDRRKQMIQQQVESAQQANGPSHGCDSDQDLSLGVVRSGGGCDTPGADAMNDSAVGGERGAAPSSATSGWAPGATGPVKASHTVTAAVNSGSSGGGPMLPSDQKAQAAYMSKHRRVVSPCPGTDSNSPKGFNNSAASTGAADSSARDEGSKEEDLPSARCGGGSVGATQQLLHRLQGRQIRADTPTRYTQSSGGVGAGGEDSADSRPQSRSSTPAGGARQACRSLGASGGQPWVDRGDSSAAFGNTGGLDTTPTNAEVDSVDVTGRHKHREPSVDGLLSSEAVRNGPLSGSSIEDYIVGKQIGQGAYATVFFGLHRESGKKVAIKIYEKYKLLDPQRRKSVRCEIRLMERLRHPNIVIFHDALDTPKQIYIIMDFVGGGSLHHFLKKRPGRRLDDQLAKRLIYQVSQGIKYLHDRHIVHRDVKLENLLLDDSGTVKIIDFGFSTIVPPGKRLKIFCGTPSYMAPEIVARKEYSGFCADIWAIGVLLYALLCGSFPFRGQNDRDLYRKIVRGVFHVPEVVTDGARSLLTRVLTPDMTRRPTIDDTLGDQWFSSHRDELYTSMGKASASCYQPNTSTSSTATTAAPSSSASAGQSARENFSGEAPQAAPSAGSRAPSASRASTPAPASSGISTGINMSGGAWSAGQTPASAAVASAVGIVSSAAQTGGRSLDVSTGSASYAAEVCGPRGSDAEDVGTPMGGGAGGATSSDTAAPRAEDASDRGCSRQFEEEAISKLERLGYPRDEIVRQLKDESSHLCKLYYRFLKALTAWDSKK